jgi:hypothetical protein
MPFPGGWVLRSLGQLPITQSISGVTCRARPVACRSSTLDLYEALAASTGLRRGVHMRLVVSGYNAHIGDKALKVRDSTYPDSHHQAPSPIRST